jgi:hypothetical protein
MPPLHCGPALGRRHGRASSAGRQNPHLPRAGTAGTVTRAATQRSHLQLEGHRANYQNGILSLSANYDLLRGPMASAGQARLATIGMREHTALPT